MNKIIVYGFPHTGTSILRKLIGNSNDVYEIPEEVCYAPDIEVPQNNIVIKYAGRHKMPMDFHETIYKEYKIILVIKNPYDVFSSLWKRFGHYDYKGCKINDWIHYGKLFLFFQENPHYRVFTIRYEEFFNNNFNKIVKMFEFLNLFYSEEKIIYNNRPCFISKKNIVPDEEPSRVGKSHGDFRTWQINQPFEDRTGQSAKDLQPNMQKILHNLEITKKLGY